MATNPQCIAHEDRLQRLEDLHARTEARLAEQSSKLTFLGIQIKEGFENVTKKVDASCTTMSELIPKVTEMEKRELERITRYRKVRSVVWMGVIGTCGFLGKELLQWAWKIWR